MRRVASLVVMVAGGLFCSSPPPPGLSSDTIMGVHVGMSRRELRRSLAPHADGKWYELESMAGESRLRWGAASADASPQSMDVTLGSDGKVRELVFALRPDDAKKLLMDLGAPQPPSGIVRYAGPSGDVVVAPGLGSWTLRLRAR